MYPYYMNTSPVLDTADTTRVLGNNPIDFNIYVTKLIYPSTSVEWRPNSIILVPLTSYHFGLLASPIIHFPINAPLMFTNPYMLQPEILNEILRLSPTGKNVPAKIIIVGPISYMVEMQLRNAGLTTIRIIGNDPVLLAGEALEFRYRIPPDSMEGRKNIMVVSAEDFSECIHASYFSAHMGVPILFAFRDMLPAATREKLMKYSDKNVFIIGSEQAISNRVLNEIKGIVKAKVERIGGSTPYEAAINFSKYYSPEGMFGWNMNTKDGWSFSFGIVKNWAENLAACIFAHLAKHTPLLYVESDRVPENVRNYVLALNPIEKHPPKPPFMHGYILGEFDMISHQTQVSLEEILIVRAGDVHH